MKVGPSSTPHSCNKPAFLSPGLGSASLGVGSEGDGVGAGLGLPIARPGAAVSGWAGQYKRPGICPEPRRGRAGSRGSLSPAVVEPSHGTPRPRPEHQDHVVQTHRHLYSPHSAQHPPISPVGSVLRNSWVVPGHGDSPRPRGAQPGPGSSQRQGKG